jgi:hypothetical protein
MGKKKKEKEGKIISLEEDNFMSIEESSEGV